MKISTKGRYALRLMLDLAVNYTGEYISIRSIAARQEISEKYLEQIITHLNRAGYVKSVRGAQGGYMLSRDPSEYTVGMILRLLEGSLAPVSCLDEEESCDRVSGCVTMEVWEKIQKAVEDVVDNITLADMVTRYQEKTEPIYII
ncbi:MAG: Rrf2 family transcriptional regulator [Eubacteriales bacterium]|nr:Rrf2 family transcriptional regulator [Eubacteriales bacterium]MDD3199405.1 Rrf2 family transcriptional regulator [Eubacteriales bacterium]MDD4122083.1 Rrf2 family transcriptional regulator [Eubacteriales bacterium]MDD4629927.1 Rrf2 family transcriptional regulator [Eubacteriales bacterium]